VAFSSRSSTAYEEVPGDYTKKNDKLDGREGSDGFERFEGDLGGGSETIT